ncbi:MAG TPA: penicillin-binding protein activator [Gallionella sp.]|nr:penicillin-binding protein activator [Gallionella sp.]
MQRGFLWLSALLALYVSGFACATNEPLAHGDDKPVPHIALLLPLKSAVFGSAAEAVRQGFQAAAELEIQLPGRLPVRVYSCFDESKDVAALYRQALAGGARAVVGPLTRSGASALAAEPQGITVPTLALNVVEGPPAGQMYFFGMAVEAEARQAAQLARQQGLHQAIVITTRAQLDQRLQFAFEEEWHRSGGTILDEIEFDDDPAVFADIADRPDTAVFLAADAEKAHFIRPYLPNKLPIYATSQIFAGNGNTLTNYDLNGIRFVDMPWLLQTDHPAVMIYPRHIPPLSADHERLYALGIDAFRLIQLLLAGKIDDALPLDGVSGHIELNGHIFQRMAVPAMFAQGQAQLRNAQAAPAPQVFPDQPAGKP